MRLRGDWRYDKCNSSVSQHHHSVGDMHSLRQGRLVAGRGRNGKDKSMEGEKDMEKVKDSEKQVGIIEGIFSKVREDFGGDWEAFEEWLKREEEE